MFGSKTLQLEKKKKKKNRNKRLIYCNIIYNIITVMIITGERERERVGLVDMNTVQWWKCQPH